MGISDTPEGFLALALRDLHSAERMQDVQEFEDYIFGFCCQQAVEKALKAWTLHCNEQPPRTHDLRALLARLDRLSQDISTFWSLSTLFRLCRRVSL